LPELIFNSFESISRVLCKGLSIIDKPAHNTQKQGLSTIDKVEFLDKV